MYLNELNVLFRMSEFKNLRKNSYQRNAVLASNNSKANVKSRVNLSLQIFFLNYQYTKHMFDV